MNEIRISDPAELQLRLLANTKDQAKIIGLNQYLILQNDTDLLFNLEEIT